MEISGAIVYLSAFSTGLKEFIAKLTWKIRRLLPVDTAESLAQWEKRSRRDGSWVLIIFSNHNQLHMPGGTSEQMECKSELISGINKESDRWGRAGLHPEREKTRYYHSVFSLSAYYYMFDMVHGCFCSLIWRNKCVFNNLINVMEVVSLAVMVSPLISPIKLDFYLHLYRFIRCISVIKAIVLDM